MPTGFDFENEIKNFIAEPFKYGDLTTQELEKYEEKLGVLLPEDYKKFLLLTNGVRSKKHFVWIRYESGMWEKIIPEIFLAVGAKESWAALSNSLGGSEEAWPQGYLGIAYDPGGNHLLLNLNKDDNFRPFGSLYFLDHEDLPELNNLRYVAPSFKSYLALAEPYDGNKELDTQRRLGQIIASENVEALEKLFLENPRLRLDEHFSYGNTLADQALAQGKKKLSKKLIELGATSPHFFKYAHNVLSEDEIVEYIKSGKYS